MTVAIYAYEARDPAGALVRGSENAVDEPQLDRMLAGRGLFLVRATASSVRRKSRKANTRTLIDFCHHLGTAVDAGIPVLDALRDLQEDGDSPIAHELEDIASKIENGQQLSACLAAHPVLFPELIRALVGAGEETGTLDRILRDLVQYLEWKEELHRKLVGSATYPIIVLVGMFGLAVLMGTVVLPRFLEIFVELGVELPLATRVLLAVHAFLSAWWIAVVVGVLAAVGLWMAWTRSARGRVWWHAKQLRIPIVGSAMTMLEMSRLTHNLGVVYTAGIPILRCLTLVESIAQNEVIRRTIAHARESVEGGETLTNALGRSPLLPTMVRRMIALGETSGRLGESLETVARYYERELPGRIDNALAYFNTAILALLGGMLVTIVLAIFVPLYQMMGSLNG